MAILAVEIAVPDAVDVKVSEDTLSVDLTDGRTISVPLGWYPQDLSTQAPKRGQNVGLSARERVSTGRT